MAKKMGRPSEYDPAFGDQIIELMEKGYSLTAAASQLGFHRQRAYDWAEKFPEFAEAITFAKARRVYKLETDLLNATTNQMVTSRIFALKNADGVEWREKSVQEHTGEGGGPVSFKVVLGGDH